MAFPGGRAYHAVQVPDTTENTDFQVVGFLVFSDLKADPLKGRTHNDSRYARRRGSVDV